MKAKDLKPVFRWKDRRVLIQDRVWFFPDYFSDPDFTFPGWDHPDLFGNKNPVHVEYCSGNGDWIIERARAMPDYNFVAVEKQFLRARKIWSKLKNHGLSNVIVVCGEGRRWTDSYVPAGSVSYAYVNFPDPWPKARHAKHRIISPDFADSVSRSLTVHGSLEVVTDDPDYSGIIVEVFQCRSDFAFRHPAPGYITDRQDYGSSFFDTLWRQKGRTIRYHTFDKR